MKISILLAVPLFTLSAQSIVLPPPTSSQEVLTEGAVHEPEIPGYNNAYYTRVAKKDQLFSIHEFAVRPNPPIVNQHDFVYLSGDILPGHALCGLENATLQLTLTDHATPSHPPEVIEKKIPEFRPEIVVRHFGQYGGPLRLGRNELLADAYLFNPALPGEKWVKNFTMEATARLPDKTILFSFAQNIVIEYPPKDDCENKQQEQ